MPLEIVRKEIDSVDEKILALLGKRAELAKKIAELKKSENLQTYAPDREKQIISGLSEKGAGDFPTEAIAAVWTEIISACRSLERKTTVAFLGPATTFTHMAAIKKFGSLAEFVAKESIPEIFSTVENEKADFGVVPVENSMEGSVVSTYDMFLNSDLNIVAEIILDIRHALLSNSKRGRIKKVFSHPQALAQCRGWLNANLPKVEIVEAASTAKAAELAAQHSSSAAIASVLAAERFGLKVLAESIQDSAKNVTRFLVIGKLKPKKTRKDKTSILFSVQNKSGSLFNALDALKMHGLNMTKIESRPSKQKVWDVVFFIDFEGFESDDNVTKALEEMRKHCLFLRVLGSYAEEISISQ